MAADLCNWNPDVSWCKEEKKISWRNLFISIPSMIAAFAVWNCWGVITVLMQASGFPFSNNELFMLVSIAGFSGATLRIPNTFMVKLAGGRNTIFITTLLLIIPAAGIGIGLQSFDTPLWYFKLMALLSGIGGGNFASSMANIGTFFPRCHQGLALGLNAGVGNLGVTISQLVIPMAVTIGIIGAPQILSAASGSLLGVMPQGSEIWIQNGGYVWLVLLIPLVIAVYFGMNNIIPLGMLKSAAVVIPMMLIGVATSGLGVLLMNIGITQWAVMPFIIVITILALKFIPGETGYNVSNQYKIFKNRNTWVMTVLYTMTFGSFIGFAAAFPLSINIIFGHSHILSDAGVLTHIPNPNAPNTLSYAWLGAFIGAAVRPFGGILSDKIGGSKVTLMCSAVMLISALVLARYMRLAYASATPEVYFIPFLLIFLLLFFMTGIGNGSTFRSVAAIFGREQSGGVTGWISAVAAYGSFFIPQIINGAIMNGTPEVALYGFAVFYALCILVCWGFYLRPGAGFRNP